jgi:broad specificity phosphatase PhoE
MTEPSTTVHLLRHGEVENPGAVLYGRLPGFHLSALGRKMAERLGSTVADRDIVRLVSSPLERAQETARPAAKALGLDIVTDDRVIEAANVFEGERFGVGDGVLRKPSAWRHVWNPIRPSWGEPYREIVVRMLAAIHDARAAAAGHEALIVSHQLPIWMVRSHVEHRHLVHDPRRRQCSLASLTSLTFEGTKVVTVTYSEPAADLIPVKPSGKLAAGA